MNRLVDRSKETKATGMPRRIHSVQLEGIKLCNAKPCFFEKSHVSVCAATNCFYPSPNIIPVTTEDPLIGLAEHSLDSFR